MRMNGMQPDRTEVEALKKLWLMAQHDNGGAVVCARLLLGLYNGPRFPFDLTELRRLDQAYLDAALTVLRMDAGPGPEVHDLLQLTYNWPAMGARFELMACDHGLKGRCDKAQERAQRAYVAEQTRLHDLHRKRQAEAGQQAAPVLKAAP
jgi:hypothetical protein